MEYKKEVSLDSQNNLRDYDKEPIVIKDYSRLFEFLFLIWAFIAILVALLLSPYRSNIPLIGLGIITCVYPLFKFSKFVSDKFIFELSNSEVRKISCDDEVNINLKDISSIKITFSDFGNNNYEYNGFTLKFIISVIYILLCLIPLVINKILFHFIKNHEFMLFDSFYIQTNDGKIINIMASSMAEFNEIKGYFSNKLNKQKYELLFKFNYDYANKEKK